MYGGEERFIEGFSGKTRRKETTWRTEALQRKVILKWILEKWTGVFSIAVVTPPQLYVCPSAPADELITFLGNISWHTEGKNIYSLLNFLFEFSNYRALCMFTDNVCPT